MKTMSPQKRIYLAGPEVFLRNAFEQLKIKKEICSSYDMTAVFPLDAEIKSGVQDLRDLHITAMRISQSNEDLIRSCDGLIANLTPFRGDSANVGTAYELGFARALGLPVSGYTTIKKTYAHRVCDRLGEVTHVGDTIEDSGGMRIEDFGLSDNLMLHGGILFSGGQFVANDSIYTDRYTDTVPFLKCVISAREYFDAPPRNF